MNSKHIVLISGGLASFEATSRVIEKFGRDSVSFWFFDTLIEDEDLYRFLNDIETSLEIKIERFADGRNPWQVFKDKRFIGNSRIDVCSRLLKRELLEKKLQQYSKEEITLYFGLEWSEGHRIENVRSGWGKKGYKTEFPLTWNPILFPQDFKNITRKFNINPPRLYDLGFSHNNCGGACIKAGIKQWSLLYQQFLERYKWHELQEQSIRKYLGKNVSILRLRGGHKVRPITLRVLRLRLDHLNHEAKSSSTHMETQKDDSACSCFVSLQDFQIEVGR